MFKKYSSIQNTYDEKNLDQIRDLIRGETDITWIVQEKLHGANFSVIYDRKTDTVRFAKRTSLLDSDEKFMGFQTLTVELERCVRNLAHRCSNKEIEIITVYGELIGGSYPGLETPKDVKRVQKEVEYCNDLRFVAFDIAFDGVVQDKTAFQMHTTSAGFQIVPTLAIYPNLDDALAYDIDFSSTIPKLLGMPPHPEKNLCEGIVISPVHPLRLGGGSRVVLKKKNAEFTDRKRKPSSNPTPFSGAKDYLTNGRFQSAVSKTGPDASVVEISKEIITDIIEDFQKDNGALDEKGLKALRKYISPTVFQFVRKAT